MQLLRGRPWFGGMAWVLGLLAVAPVLAAVIRPVVPWQNVCPDFIQFWTAAELLRAGASPYDAAEQTRIQRQYGFDRDSDGAGSYDFMPYYYPPWLGLLFIPLLPLGYEMARLTWFVLLFELLVLSGYLLRDLAPGMPRWGTLVLTPLFAFSLLAALVGQVAPLILFLNVAAWLLLERGWDRSAGWMIAGLMTKPHLTLTVAAAVLFWSLKRGRWGVIQGSLVGLTVLGLVSACFVPDWPLQMIQAPTRIPLVTVERPWMSVTWYSFWQTVGLTGWAFWGMYILGVGLAAGLLVYSLRQRSSPLGEVFALSIVAAFFLIPYARAYDEAILIVPLIQLVRRLRPVGAMLLLIIYIILPTAQLCLTPTWGPQGREIMLCWPPSLLALAWLASNCRRETPGTAKSRNTLAHFPGWEMSAKADSCLSHPITLSRKLDS